MKITKEQIYDVLKKIVLTIPALSFGILMVVCKLLVFLRVMPILLVIIRPVVNLWAPNNKIMSFKGDEQ